MIQPSGMSARRNALFGNLLLAVASLVSFLVLIELGAKIAGVPKGAPLIPHPRNCLRRSPLLGLEFRPHCQGELSFTSFSTNGLGLRGPEVGDEGAFRILAIGDSCTWGWAVSQDASYPAVLQRLLEERFGVGRFQVINAGAPGYTSYQGLLYLGERGLALRPAIVIMGFGFNDASRVGEIEQQLATERRLLPLMVVDDFLFQHSRVYGALRRRTTRAQDGDRAPRVDPTRFARNLETMVQLVREHGAHPLVLSFSTTQGGGYAQALESVTSRLDVPLIVYEGRQLDVVHPSAGGYSALAARVLDQFKREGWVQ